MNKIIYIIIAFPLLFFSRTAIAQNATDSSDTIREKVQEKVNQTLNSPKAYIGSVTDLSEKTLQISKYIGVDSNDKSNEIQQVSTSDDSVFVNVTGDAKTVKFSDVAIGDFIVAMGYVNGSSVLEAERILITQKLTPTNRKSIYGSVTSINGKVVTVESQNSQIKLKFGKSWQGPEISDIEEGDQIIAAGAFDNELEVRTLFIIPNESPSPAATPQETASPTP